MRKELQKKVNRAIKLIQSASKIAQEKSDFPCLNFAN